MSASCLPPGRVAPELVFTSVSAPFLPEGDPQAWQPWPPYLWLPGWPQGADSLGWEACGQLTVSPQAGRCQHVGRVPGRWNYQAQDAPHLPRPLQPSGSWTGRFHPQSLCTKGSVRPQPSSLPSASLSRVGLQTAQSWGGQGTRCRWSSMNTASAHPAYSKQLWSGMFEGGCPGKSSLALHSRVQGE